MKRPDKDTNEQSLMKHDIDLLMSELYFILGKISHKSEDYDQAMTQYLSAVKFNEYNFAARFCLAKIHYLNGNIISVVENLNKILANPQYKDCYEVLELYAKIKL
jgi:tetratricopeptide (TPR) repeat protein